MRTGHDHTDADPLRGPGAAAPLAAAPLARDIIELTEVGGIKMRRRILFLLSSGPMDVGHIVATLGFDKALVSRHLTALTLLGALVFVREKTRHIYRIGPAVLVQRTDSHVVLTLRSADGSFETLCERTGPQSVSGRNPACVVTRPVADHVRPPGAR